MFFTIFLFEVVRLATVTDESGEWKGKIAFEAFLGDFVFPYGTTYTPMALAPSTQSLLSDHTRHFLSSVSGNECYFDRDIDGSDTGNPN